MLKRLLSLWVILFVAFWCYAAEIILIGKLLNNPELPHTKLVLFLLPVMYPLGQLVCAPATSFLARKYGRELVLRCSFLVYAFSMLSLIYCFLHHYLILFFLACFISGIAGSNMTLILSLISSSFCLRRISNHIAMSWVVSSLGYLGGTLAAVLVLQHTSISQFLLILSLLSIVSYLINLVNIHNLSSPAAISQAIKSGASTATKMQVGKYYLANMLFYFAYFGILRIQLIYFQNAFSLPPQQMLFVYLHISLITAIALFIITPWMLKRHKSSQAIKFGLMTILITLLLILLPKTGLWMLVTTALIGLSVPILIPTACALSATKASGQGDNLVQSNYWWWVSACSYTPKKQLATVK